MAGEGEGVQFVHSFSFGFSKTVSSKETVNPWSLVTSNVIVSHIFSENLIKITQVVQRIWRLFLLIFAIFINFHQLLRFFLVKKKLMRSAYSRWCKHFFTFNILFFFIIILITQTYKTKNITITRYYFIFPIPFKKKKNLK